MTAKELRKLEDQNQKKRTESIKNIGYRFENYRKLLWKWIARYIIFYLVWCLFEYFFVNWKWFIKFTNNRGDELRELILLVVEIFLALLRGFLFSADGFITAQLKAPFGQICFYVNKSEKITEKTKDEMIEKITESNEHCKETFKKFGIVAIASETVKVLKRMKLEDFRKSQINPRSLSFYLKIIRKKIVPLLSYAVPIYFSDKKIKNINKNLEEIRFKNFFSN